MGAVGTAPAAEPRRDWRRRLLAEPGVERQARIALLLLLVAGLIVRLALYRAYQPALPAGWDSLTYLDRAANYLWSNLHQPAGYPLFVRAMHVFTDSLSLMMVLQHVLGMVAAVASYDAARRLGAGPFAALLPVAAIAINLDVTFLEHSPLSEALFIPVIAFAVWAMARARTARDLRRRLLWIALAGLLVGSLGTIRTVGLVGLPFAGFGALLLARSPRQVLALGAVFAVSAGGLLGLYAVVQHNAIGGGYSLVRGTGWAAYSGVAEKADCSRFAPPPGTAVLCEKTPLSQRGDGDFYAFNPASPAFKLAPEGFPHKDALFAAWAAAAERSLPPGPPFPFNLISDAAVALRPKDVGDIGYQYIAPDVAARIRTGFPHYLDVGKTEMRPSYQRFMDYQPYFRLSGTMALIGILLVLLALLWGRGRRWAMLLTVLPVCASWVLAMNLQRYYAPTYVLLAFTVALAISALYQRIVEQAQERLRPPATGGW